MALTNHTQPASHVIVANVGSGDIHFVDIASRQVMGCVRTAAGFAAAGGSLAAHAYRRRCRCGRPVWLQQSR
jgi:hypothetical protein